MKTERNVRSPDLFERKGYADDGEFDWTGRTMSTPVNNCLQNLRTTVAVIGPQVQNQDPISPSGRGRHNTGKDGKVRVSSVVASNLFPPTCFNWNKYNFVISGNASVERIEALRHRYHGGGRQAD